MFFIKTFLRYQWFSVDRYIHSQKQLSTNACTVISLEEKNLIDAVRKNDHSAVSAIFLNYHSILCRVSFRMVGDADEAKDVVQKVFIKLWKNRDQLNITISLEAYLKRAVVNTSLNHLESKKKFLSLDSTMNEFNKIGERSVEHQDDSKELSLRINQAIENLPIRTRAVYQMVRHEEMSYKDVAAGLNISEKAVEKEMMKALRLLRVALKDYLP